MRRDRGDRGYDLPRRALPVGGGDRDRTRRRRQCISRRIPQGAERGIDKAAARSWPVCSCLFVSMSSSLLPCFVCVAL